MNELENRSCHLHSVLLSVGMKQQAGIFLNCSRVWKQQQKLLKRRGERDV